MKKLFFTIVAIVICMFLIDFRRASGNKAPLFAIKVAVYKDGGTKKYWGPGYEIIAWNRVAIKTLKGRPVNGIEKGCEVNIFPFIRKVSKGPRKHLQFTPVNS